MKNNNDIVPELNIAMPDCTKNNFVKISFNILGRLEVCKEE